MGRFLKALTGMLAAPFRWLFIFPPVERRPLINGFIKYFIFADYDRKFDEAYVYYKVFMLNLFLNFFYMSGYIFSFLERKDMNLWLVYISYRPDAPVEELVYGYPLYVFPILVIATVVYSAILFLFKTDYWSKERV